MGRPGSFIRKQEIQSLVRQSMNPETNKSSTSNQVPLYSTRIIKIYLEYLETKYPQAKLDAILNKSGIEKYEIDDSAHWLTQQQIDRFHDAVLEETGDKDASREAGKFAAYSKHVGPLKQFILGLISPSTLFLLLEKIHPLVSRGAILTSRKIGFNKVEIITRPSPQANEKIYQCENRLGFWEAIILLFTNSDIRIKHNECYHKGYPHCKYVIEWGYPHSHLWKRLFKLSLIVGFPSILAFLYILPYPISGLSALGVFVTILLLSLRCSLLEKKELIELVKNQGKTAQDHLVEINKRYNNALLFQEIGQYTTTIHSTEELIDAIGKILEQHMEFDAGLITTTDADLNQLIIKTGFGVKRETRDFVDKTVKIDHNLTNLSVVKALLSKKAIVAAKSALTLDQSWLESIGIKLEQAITSTIFVPMVYQDVPLGILCFFNYSEKNLITESDINYLSGVASQLATGITNARSFEYLKDSEEKYRALIEATNTGFVIVDKYGKVQDANPEYVRLTGYKHLEEIKGRKVKEWTAEQDLEKLESAINEFQKDSLINNFMINHKDADGNLIPIEMNAAAVSFKNSSYIMSICRDMTDQKRTQEIMIQTEKMSTVGALAAGMAHELNNPLAGILQTLQVLKTRLKGRSPKFNQTIKTHGITLESFNSVFEKLDIFEKIDSVIETGKYAADIVNNMVNFSQKDTARYTKHNIISLLDRTIEIAKSDYSLKDDYDFKSIEIVKQYDRNIPDIPCASAKMQQVFLTILKNGVQEMFQNRSSQSSPIFILKASVEGKYVRIDIEDNGPGMSEEVVNHIFEPFYSTKQVGTGIGLGLSLAYFIVKDNHGGELSVDTVPGKGTRFIIKLPIDHISSD